MRSTVSDDILAPVRRTDGYLPVEDYELSPAGNFVTAITVPNVVRSVPAGAPSSARRRGRWLLGVTAVAAPALIAALPVVGFREGQSIGFLALVPLAASMWLTWRRTAAVGAYALDPDDGAPGGRRTGGS